MNVYLISHEQYDYLGVPALAIDLFKEAIPEFRNYQDDEDYPMARPRRVVSVAKQFPETFPPTAECSTWTLPDEAGAEFDRIWATWAPGTDLADKYDVYVHHALPDGKTEETLATGIPVAADTAPREAWNYAAKGFSGTVRRCGDKTLLFTFAAAGQDGGYEEWQRSIERADS